MIITKRALPRRTFLRGMMGATMALPLLEAMVPAATSRTPWQLPSTETRITPPALPAARSAVAAPAAVGSLMV